MSDLVDYKSGYSACDQLIADIMIRKGFSRISAAGEAMDVYNEQSEAWGLKARFGFLDSIVNALRQEQDDIDRAVYRQEVIEENEEDDGEET
jgi:hypothetical protein